MAHPDLKLEFNSWYVDVNGETAVIDPLEPSENLLRFMEVRGVPDCVILTNARQTRWAETFRDLYDCPVWVHEEDEQKVEIPVDRTFSDKDVLSCGLEAIQLHHQQTPGTVALHLPDATPVMIVGDALATGPAGELLLPPAEVLANPADARMALARLLEYDFNVLLTGLGTPILKGAHARLRAFLSNA